jgi:nitroreductase
MERRQSSRVPFDPHRAIPAADLARILEAARWAPTAHNMQNFDIVVVDDPDTLEAIGRIGHTVSLEFIRENFAQLAASPEELRTRKTGILAAHFPPAWTTRDTLARVPEETRHGTLGDTLAGSPVLLVVTWDPRRRAPASEHDALGVMSLGCMLENAWLMAESLGVSMQVVSAFGAEGVERELRHVLGVPDGLRIAFAVRLGYPVVEPPAAVRVRRDLADFVHHNQFSNAWQGAHAEAFAR